MYPHERSLVKRLSNKPFALLGVNSDKNLPFLKARLVQENITWRSFWNGPLGIPGPIASRWGVRGWPTIYVLDDQGVIRFVDLRGEELDAAIDQLLAEIESR
jgi:hypothetical protein